MTSVLWLLREWLHCLTGVCFCVDVKLYLKTKTNVQQSKGNKDIEIKSKIYTVMLISLSKSELHVSCHSDADTFKNLKFFSKLFLSSSPFLEFERVSVQKQSWCRRFYRQSWEIFSRRKMSWIKLSENLFLVSNLTQNLWLLFFTRFERWLLLISLSYPIC